MNNCLKTNDTITVSTDLFVMRKKNDFFRHGLGDEHSVKRVAMQPWQLAHLLRMRRDERKLANAGRHRIPPYLLGRTRHKLWLQGMLDCDLQNRNRAEKQLRIRRKKLCANLVRQPRAISQKPYQCMGIKQYPHRIQTLSACRALCHGPPSLRGKSTCPSTCPCAL